MDRDFELCLLECRAVYLEWSRMPVKFYDHWKVQKGEDEVTVEIEMLVKSPWKAVYESLERLYRLLIDKYAILVTETHETKRKMKVDQIFEPASEEMQNAWVGVVEQCLP